MPAVLVDRPSRPSRSSRTRRHTQRSEPRSSARCTGPARAPTARRRRRATRMTTAPSRVSNGGLTRSGAGPAAGSSRRAPQRGRDRARRVPRRPWSRVGVLCPIHGSLLTLILCIANLTRFAPQSQRYMRTVEPKCRAHGSTTGYRLPGEASSTSVNRPRPGGDRNRRVDRHPARQASGRGRIIAAGREPERLQRASMTSARTGVCGSVPPILPTG